MNRVEHARALALKIQTAANTPILSLAGHRLPPSIFVESSEYVPTKPIQILRQLNNISPGTWTMTVQNNGLLFSRQE